MTTPFSLQYPLAYNPKDPTTQAPNHFCAFGQCDVSIEHTVFASLTDAQGKEVDGDTMKKTTGGLWIIQFYKHGLHGQCTLDVYDRKGGHQLASRDIYVKDPSHAVTTIWPPSHTAVSTTFPAWGQVNQVSDVTATATPTAGGQPIPGVPQQQPGVPYTYSWVQQFTVPPGNYQVDACQNALPGPPCATPSTDIRAS